MKRRILLTAFFISGLTFLQASLNAAPAVKKVKFRTWEKEVAHYLHNVVLPSKLNDGLVIIHFTVDQAHSIQNLDIYSDNMQLKEAFRKRLLGKSLNSLDYLPTQAEPTQEGYLLKVHLKVR